MKRFGFYLTYLLGVLALSTSLIIPVSANSLSQTIPTSIAGLPVIYVETPSNTLGLQPGTIDIVLLEKNDSTTTEHTSRKLVSEHLNSHSLPNGWSISVIGGPNVSKDEFQKDITAHNEWYLKNSLTISTNQSLLTTVSPATALPTVWAIDQYGDTSNYQVTEQDVTWTAPYKYDDNQDMGHFTTLLNNIWTNTGSFIQTGEIFWAYGTPQNTYACNSWTFNRYYISTPYVANHIFTFVIVYTGGQWLTECYDHNSMTWDDEYTPATGNYAANTADTSVFFENNNTNPLWWTFFYTPGYQYPQISVNLAWDKRNGMFSSWNNDTIVIRRANRTTVIPTPPGIIGGGLKNFGTATWYLQNVPYVGKPGY